MRQSQLFGRTIREVPSDAQIPSHRLLVRAGMIRQLSAGLYTTLPLAQLALRKIERIVREEMDRIGGQELNMPLVQPAELWRETGRYDDFAGKELLAFRDRNDRENVLAMTHEESVTSHARTELQSYRQLPVMVYQIKMKFRDEPRPRAGLIRVREFVMKDAYSFHADAPDLDRYYMDVYGAYERIFSRCGVPTMVVEADAGMIGGSAAHEFMLVTPSGEDSLILCPGCNYTANADVAVFDKGAPDFGPPEPIDEVPTPDCKTIEVVATFLGVSTSQTMKAVFYIADDRFVFVVIRGDLGVNKTKLRNRLGVAEIRPATDKEIRAAGAVPGYASPIGLSSEMTVVVDDSVERMTNAVAGANKDGYHVRHVNFPRDFTASLVGDVALAVEGATCAHCGGVLQEANGVEVGHIFKLGDKYSKVMGATYLDDTGRQRPLIMGCYGIGVGRLLAAAVEANYDDDGIVFPISVAPFEVHLVPVGRGVEAVKAADLLYDEWTAAGIEVLYDDRDESPGVKFKDSDLIGIPIRITVSARTLEQDAYEVKCRWKPDREIVPRGTFDLRAYVDQAWAEVASTVASANGEPA